jgi:hypothetical protein
MNKQNKEIVKACIDEVAKTLQLPPSVKHPKGRNPHAHIARVIKDTCGSSYTELSDESLPIVLEIIQYCRNHPF